MKKSMVEGRCGSVGVWGFVIGVTLWALVGCVDVPDRSPMGGMPSDDADPPDVAQVSDGALPPVPDVGDRDDLKAPDIDRGGVGDAGGAADGRPDGAAPGPAALPPPPRLLDRDPDRCPNGGALIPGLGQCFVLRRVPDLPAMRSRATGAVLDDGRVLVAGGWDADDAAAHGETWVFDGDTWAEGPPLALITADARSVAIDERRILVVGGSGDPDAPRAVQVVGPELEAWTAARLVEPRFGGFSLHRLADGRVVVVGGETRGGRAGVAGAEVVDGAMAAEDALDDGLEPMGVPRRAHAAALDAEGALWIIGGEDGEGRARFAPEVLRPDARSWESVPGPGGWAMVGGAAAASGDGVLFAGGRGSDGESTARAGIYDPIARAWIAVGALNAAEAEITMASVGGEGAVLVVGASAIEIFDPIEGVFYGLLDRGLWGRTRPVMLPVDGGVLVIGGERDGRVLSRGYIARLEPARPPLAEEAEPAEEADREGG